MLAIISTMFSLTIFKIVHAVLPQIVISCYEIVRLARDVSARFNVDGGSNDKVVGGNTVMGAFRSTPNSYEHLRRVSRE
jgi:hypothetical protein